MFRRFFLPYLVWWFYRFLNGSWKKIIVEHPLVQQARENNQAIILAHWHGDELALLHLVKKYRLVTMTSTSKDGQLIDFIIRKFGGKTSKGSSTRGGVGALKGLIRLVRKGNLSSMAVDGPKGPIYKVKPGVFELSRLTGALIVPLGVHSVQKLVFHKAWNKAFLPKPFSRVGIYLGEPLPALSRDQKSKDLKLAEKLQDMLFDARQKAIKLVAQD